MFDFVAGEVMVIVEYCRFGNLQNFLVKHREYFVDQIVRDKDIIDPTIMTRDQRWSNDSGYEYYNRYFFWFEKTLCDHFTFYSLHLLIISLHIFMLLLTIRN